MIVVTNMLFTFELPPTDEVCQHCEEPIRPGDFAPTLQTVHRVCAIRMVVGSVGHQTAGEHVEGTCAPDDPALTRYQAAVAAFKHWRANMESQQGGFFNPASPVARKVRNAKKK